MPSTRATVQWGITIALAGGAYILWLIMSHAGRVPEIPMQISGVARSVLVGGAVVLVVSAILTAALRQVRREADARTGAALARVEKLTAEIAARLDAQAAAAPSARRVEHVYVSRAAVTAELPRVMSTVDPDVVDLGARLTRRMRGDDA